MTTEEEVAQTLVECVGYDTALRLIADVAERQRKTTPEFVGQFAMEHVSDICRAAAARVQWWTTQPWRELR